MKYILNETPIKTTKGFNVNNIKLDLDLPNITSFHDYEMKNTSNIQIEESVLTNYSNRIGISHNLCKNINIKVTDDLSENLIINYKFDHNDNLVDNIDIDVNENRKSTIIINYESITNNQNYHNGNINVNLSDKSSLELVVINNLNKSSINMISSTIKCNTSSKIKVTLLDLKGSIRLYNFESTTYKNAESLLNNIYIGKENDIIDLNYNYINLEENSNSNIEVQGVLLDNAVKTFKGIIDFKKGSNNSIGKENENCLLLSDNVVSKSLPMLLCSEENVEGAHSVSSGKIDEHKLFYLMSRGISLEEAKKLIITSNFEAIIGTLPDDIKEEIRTVINDIV